LFAQRKRTSIEAAKEKDTVHLVQQAGLPGIYALFLRVLLGGVKWQRKRFASIAFLYALLEY